MTTLHIGASIAALILGAMVASLPKGTSLHRRLGWCYVLATCLYAGSSFRMYPSTGRITAFHAIAVQSIVLVAGGVGAARARYRGFDAWRVWHLRFMLYSYVALVATGLRFTLPYIAGLGPAGPLAVFTLVPLCGWWWIERRAVRQWRRSSKLRHAAEGLEV